MGITLIRNFNKWAHVIIQVVKKPILEQSIKTET